MNLVDTVLQVNKAANEALDKVGRMNDYTDENGIRHIYVLDLSKEYELVNGEWVEKAPF